MANSVTAKPSARAFDRGTPNWVALMGIIARELLGEAPVTRGDEWRYRRRGSLCVDISNGRWFDHEAGRGGGVLALVEHVHGCGRTEALEWLGLRGFIARGDQRRVNRTRTARRIPPPSRPSVQTGVAPDTDRETPLRRIWLTAVPADGTLGRVYLAARWVWPPAGTGPDVPDTVRWLPRKDAPDPCSALHWPGLPRGANGALVFAWRVPGASPDAPVQAISLEALDANGVHVVPRWRRTIGSRKGCTFEVNTGGDAGIVVVEGEADALAACWLYRGHQACACGGTAGLMSWKPPEGDSREIIVEADGDRAGIRAAASVQARLLSRGRTARIVWNAPGMDTASKLEEWLVERAAVREFDGRMGRTDAVRSVWTDLLHRK